MAVTLPTPAAVRVIITTAMTDEQIQSVIEDAALMAEVCLSIMSSERQAAVLKWLTAHLIVSMGGLSKGAGGAGEVTSKSIGDASESYASVPLTGDGLKSTRYGLQAIALDPNGCLINIGKIKAKMRVL